jgi:hypothetical protein
MYTSHPLWANPCDTACRTLCLAIHSCRFMARGRTERDGQLVFYRTVAVVTSEKRLDHILQPMTWIVDGKDSDPIERLFRAYLPQDRRAL